MTFSHRSRRIRWGILAAMLSFMVLAAPRSATTWVANWLTTDATLCLHDPLWRRHYTELDAIESPKLLGVSCTGLANWVDWVNAHPARKVVLHRDPREVAASLERIGLQAPPDSLYAKLDQVRGLHLLWSDVFEDPKSIYEYLLERPFDAERHAALLDIEMQPHFTGLKIGHDVTRKLLGELRALG